MTIRLRSTPICTRDWATSGRIPVITTSAPRSATAWAALTSPEATGDLAAVVAEHRRLAPPGAVAHRRGPALAEDERMEPLRHRVRGPSATQVFVGAEPEMPARRFVEEDKAAARIRHTDEVRRAIDDRGDARERVGARLARGELFAQLGELRAHPLEVLRILAHGRG